MHPVAAAIAAILQPDEIILEDSPLYEHESLAWLANKDSKPPMALRPRSVSALQALMRFVYDSDLDFAMRSTGVGSSSGWDLVISMTAFDGFSFDAEQENVTVGAGQTWGDVDRKMDSDAQGYAVVGARQPYVGVGGCILGGGLSWLSHEFGLISDPANLLDAQVVLSDGRVVWAKEEEDLLWALRGGGGNFGIVTAFKLKPRPFPRNVFRGFIIYPQSSLAAVSQAVSAFTREIKDPKVALHTCILNPGSPFFPSSRFDRFFVIEGLVDMTKEQSLMELLGITANTTTPKGKIKAFMGGALVADVDDEFLMRMSEWFDRIVSHHPALAEGSYVLLEVLQEGALNSSGSLSATAWPHAYHRYVLQLGVGSLTDTDYPNELAYRLMQESYAEIAPGHEEGDFFPNVVEEFMDVSKIYKSHYDKLRKLKTKYDSRARFDKGIFMPPYISEGVLGS
ncbi:hypothetical protein MMC30_000152 [Trapelia coarctata]|nr:hypothetical protein [Trapelia coarctata]